MRMPEKGIYPKKETEKLNALAMLMKSKKKRFKKICNV